jgi:hypothetical protein
MASEKGCEAECANNSDCKYFTYQPTRKLCIYCNGCEYQQYDGHKYRDYTTWKKEAGSAVPQQQVSFTVDNHLRTSFFDDAGYLQNVPKPYRICSVEEKIGGVISFGADCSGMIPNPAIALDSFPKDSLVVRTEHLADTRYDTVSNGVRLPGVKILGQGNSTFSCDTAPMHGPQFAISEPDRSIYMFDRRVRTAENTLAQPDAKRPAAVRYECPNVPKNFLNAHTCRTGAESCSPIGYSSKMFTLDEAIIKKFYTVFICCTHTSYCLVHRTHTTFSYTILYSYTLHIHRTNTPYCTHTQYSYDVLLHCTVLSSRLGMSTSSPG